jgi:hypothetical protein
MKRIALLLLFVAVIGINAQEHCFFIPPEGWMPAAKENLSPLVKVGFLDPKNFGFRASLNLAEEEIDCNLEEYLEAVKNIHTNDHHNIWSNLGHYPTKAGPAVLTQIDSTSSWGSIRILQLILVRDTKAYVLTAAASKKQFSKYLSAFKAAFNSLTITEDLFSAVSDTKKREKVKELQTAYFNGEEASWENFQNEILHGFKELGAHWQALIISETLKK